MKKLAHAFEFKALVITCLVSLSTFSACAQQGSTAQGSFKVVDNPGGGQYVYGPMRGRGTLPDAIVYMLRQVHGHFGDRPEVGKFFQSRDGSSVAAFFTATGVNQGNKPMAGLLIVSMARDGSASAAVLYDDKSRFGATEPAMMKSLGAVWEPVRQAGAPAAAQPSHHSGPAPLTESTAGDRSASIGLPAGWKLTSVASGTLTAVGPNSEMLFLGMLYQGFQRGPDPFTDFVNINNQLRRNNGMPAGNYQLLSRTSVGGRAVQVIYNVDFNDGVGPRKGSARLDIWGPRALSVDGSNIPARLAQEEAATMQAVISSFRQNEQMMAALRQGAQNRVNADIARAQAQTVAIDARREASNAAYEQHSDDLARQSKSKRSFFDTLSYFDMTC